MTAKDLTFILSFSLFAGVTASAATFKEEFNNPFLAWESGWLALNSNLQNADGVGAPRNELANPDGLWLSDGLDLTNQTKVSFDPEFGSKLTSFSLDVATYVSLFLERPDLGIGRTELLPILSIEIFDIAGDTLLNSLVSPTFGAGSNPGSYVRFSAVSTNGIGGFSFSVPVIPPNDPYNGYPIFLLIDDIEGNTSIDNVAASTKSTAQVPDAASTSLLIGLGLVTLAAFRRRYVR